VADESFSLLGPLPHPSENPDPETLRNASLEATPAQRLAWLDEALQLSKLWGRSLALYLVDAGKSERESRG
jgi:hypothetical protein